MVYFEPQVAGLCAVHALNTLLQGPVFTAIDLSDIALALDEKEHALMADGGGRSGGSHNVDLDGNYSVQVIERALETYSLSLEAVQASDSEASAESAYIANLNEHWFTIRRVGAQWFNLNSLFSEPQLLQPTHLGMFLTQLRMEGWVLFKVKGSLPPVQSSSMSEEEQFQAAIAASLLSEVASGNGGGALESNTGEDDASELERALAMSVELQGTEPATRELTLEELRERRLAALQQPK